MDLNRWPAPQHPLHQTPTQAVRQFTFRGLPLYEKPLTPALMTERLTRFHAPFYQKLHQEIARLRPLTGQVLVLDLHSFGKRKNLPYELDLGTRHGASAEPSVWYALLKALQDHMAPLSISLDRTYPGGYMTRHVMKQAGCQGLQLEILRHSYGASTSDITDPVLFRTIKMRLKKSLEQFVQETQSLLPHDLCRIRSRSR